MLEGMEGVCCAFEAVKGVLCVLKVLDGVRCVPLCMRSPWIVCCVLELAGSDALRVLCAVGRGSSALFAGGANGDELHSSSLCAVCRRPWRVYTRIVLEPLEMMYSVLELGEAMRYRIGAGGHALNAVGAGGCALYAGGSGESALFT